ncbi:MAG TPA: hypothetical protein VN943_20605, partial [Candidatus Acidoferrum sp.]|nr:hypothetical protein [Candidatus Acidoferrum sp.]
KSKSELTPEEKLLHAIFGRAGEDVKNDSLEVPSGVEGIVIDTQRFSRRASMTDDERKAFDKEQKELENRFNKQIADQFRAMIGEMAAALDKKEIKDTVTNRTLATDKEDKAVVEQAAAFKLDHLDVRSPERQKHVAEVFNKHHERIAFLLDEKERKLNSLKRGDELPSGVQQMVKVYVATKRQISVGDKMAGRHGNKGVIARIVPQEDMPYLPDGTPVEIVLNPLGVPSRMNVGQILETHLGWAAKELGNSLKRLLSKEVRAEALRRWFREVFADTAIWKMLSKLSDDDLLEVAEGFRDGIPFATPVFDGAREAEIRHLLEVAGLPHAGKINLFDGMTGDQFDQPVTVGYIYMLKLSHLVDDKIHARSIGPYSLITQQPLGGKAQFGGQRFGEMEVWALEAYGAAHILQELLTAKSDDVYGRAKIYEAIVKGEPGIEPGVPESFNVLVRELQSLCLDVELMKRQKPAEKAAD